MVGTRRDLQSCNACPCHIIARRSNPQQTSTLFLLGPRSVMTVACMHSHCSNSFVVVPMFPVPATSANLPLPRVETGQGNWKIVGSLRQFAIFCGLLGSLSLSLSLPFHKHSGRESSADHPSWHSLGPKTTRRRCPTLSCLCAHRQRPRPGCGCLVLGSLVWSEVCVKARLCLCMSWCLMRGGVADLRQ
jgi:hypothetical protein